jgi:hypothetical protein
VEDVRKRGKSWGKIEADRRNCGHFDPHKTEMVLEEDKMKFFSFIVYLVFEDTAIPCLTLGVTFFNYTMDIKTALCNSLENSAWV